MPDTDLTTMRNVHETTLESAREKILSILPSESPVLKRRFFAAATGLMISDTSITRCSPKSLLIAVWNCARVGLVPDPNLGHIWMIPYRIKDVMTATVLIGYKGRVELARRSGQITVVRTRIIHANDEYEFHDGLNQHLDINPWWVRGKDSPGELVATYCVAEFKAGGKDLYVAPKYEIEESRRRSQAAQSGRGPWVDDPEAMARVVPVRRAWATWPQSAEMAYAEKLDWQADAGESQENDDISEVLPNAAAMDEGMTSYGPPPRWERIRIQLSEVSDMNEEDSTAVLEQMLHDHGVTTDLKDLGNKELDELEQWIKETQQDEKGDPAGVPLAHFKPFLTEETNNAKEKS